MVSHLLDSRREEIPPCSPVRSVSRSTPDSRLGDGQCFLPVDGSWTGSSTPDEPLGVRPQSRTSGEDSGRLGEEGGSTQVRSHRESTPTGTGSEREGQQRFLGGFYSGHFQDLKELKPFTVKSPTRQRYLKFKYR